MEYLYNKNTHRYVGSCAGQVHTYRRTTSLIGIIIFIYHCLPTALVTADIPWTATYICCEMTLYVTNTWRIPNFDDDFVVSLVSYHLYSAELTARFTILLKCYWNVVTYVPIILLEWFVLYERTTDLHMIHKVPDWPPYHSLITMSLVNRANIRRHYHCHARRLRNFRFASCITPRFAVYVLARAISVHAGSLTSAVFSWLSSSTCTHIYALSLRAAARHNALLRSRCPRVKSCCSPTRHKVRQIGTSCDREAAPRMFPLFHRIAPCT